MNLLVVIPPLAAEEEARKGGTLVAAILGDLATLNPDTTIGIQIQIVSCQIFDSLIGYDWDQNPVPRLAKSWEVSDDGLTYTVHLVDQPIIRNLPRLG